MQAGSKYTGRAASFPVGLAYGAAVSLLVTVAVSAVLAKLIDLEKLPWEKAGYAVGALLAAASFAGAVTAWRKVRRQRLLTCLAAGGVYFALLLTVTALFFGGEYGTVGVGGGLIALGCGAAALPGAAPGTPGRRKKLRVPNR